MRERTCCFTGHRAIPETERAAILAATETAVRALIAEGYCYFGVGGAIGYDTLAAQLVLRLRAEFPQVRLIAVIPCADQAATWNAADRAAWEHLLAQADKVVCLQERYTPECMKARDRRLVDHSSVCVAYLKRYGGGTGYTVSYAERQGVRVIRVS